MTDDDSIERKVDEALTRFEIRDEHIKRRKPQQPSFRYLSPEESKEELEKETIESVSVMTKPGTPKVTVDDVFVMGVGGDMDAIEDIIRRHQESRKFKEK
ncbi:MAG: hypothetical protein MUO82_04720 [Candidatus Thermoplasmatota archaeon]|nr:hypothetical protein [Candidatus Thermoplasmatota archaeon]